MGDNRNFARQNQTAKKFNKKKTKEVIGYFLLLKYMFLAKINDRNHRLIKNMWIQTVDIVEKKLRSLV